MGVSGTVVAYLRASGHEAVHLRDEGLHRIADEAVFAKARDEGSVLVTFDLDFSEIAALSGAATPSVIPLRLVDTRPAHVAARIAAVLSASGESLASGAIIVVEDRRHRVRRLPIGRPPEAGDAGRR